MRIIKTRFKNLNSLAGEWSIDFTRPEFSSDGIFAITGPTGAGKTTILDALCLALYGQTPRLAKVTKSANEIMSRQAGECFAEVVFESQGGRFLSHWSQRRSRKKPGGELQSPKHELAEAASGKIIESSIRGVAERIEALTGMDFTRFTRSMLLAQGGFAVFLNAAPDERSPILEQITGTEIYSQISKKTHERRSCERSKLETLAAELSGMRLLSEEDENRIRGELEEKLSVEKGFAKKSEELGKALAWLDGVAALEVELAEATKRLEEFKAQEAEFKPELQRLETASKALTLYGDYAHVSLLRKQRARDLAARSEAEDALPIHEKDLAEALQAAQNSKGKLDEARTSQAREMEIIKKVREFDALLGEKIGQEKAAVASLAAKDAEIKSLEARASELACELEISLQEAAGINDFLGENAVDAGLMNDLSAIGKTFDRLKDLQKESADMQRRSREAEAKLKTKIAELMNREAEKASVEAALQKAEATIKTLSERMNSELNGRPLGRLRLDFDALRERKLLLEKASELLGRMASARQELEKLDARAKALNIEQENTAALIEVETGKQIDCEQRVKNLEEQVARLNRIRDLDAERPRLEDGKPCPLCGAVEHPYAKGNVPDLDEAEKSLRGAKSELNKILAAASSLMVLQAKTETNLLRTIDGRKEKYASLEKDVKQSGEVFARLEIDSAAAHDLSFLQGELEATIKNAAEIAKTIETAGRLESELASSREFLETARINFQKSEKTLQAAIHEKDIAQNEFHRFSAEGASIVDRLEISRAKALEEVAPYGITELYGDALAKAWESLSVRRDLWQKNQEAKTLLDKKISELNAEAGSNKSLADQMERDRKTTKKIHDEIAGGLESLRRQRKEMYGEKITDAEEARFVKSVESAGLAFESCRERQARAGSALAGLKSKIESLDEAIKNRNAEMEKVEKDFVARLAQVGFESEEDYKAARLPDEERERLKEKADAIKNKSAELETLGKSKAEALGGEKKKQVSDRPREELQGELTACGEMLKEASQAIGAARQSLKENEEARNSRRGFIEKIEAQKKECSRWDALHELIGSADGKKYRNFAQGLTFEIMISHANLQLRKMTDRYLLMRDKAQPLELNVIDDYQAGEIRSAKNLSGGESFIVSLALALGLSNMASRNVRVDSLFLDEGFGTLDEDALETALETLASLRREGKLIGVISHVPALKERISTQIQVVPIAMGRSAISGPGCEKALDS